MEAVRRANPPVVLGRGTVNPGSLRNHTKF